jgi:hypothetical protein
MKATLSIVVLSLLIPVAASAQDGRINLSFLDRLGERASEKQEIIIGPEMLANGQALIRPEGRCGEADRLGTEGHLRPQL